MTKKTNQTTGTAKETAKRQPTHLIYQVIGEGEKAKWMKVGAGWTHNKDGKGLYLRFDAYPLTGRIQVREITEQQDAQDGGQQ
jgi:hypothetical protein